MQPYHKNAKNTGKNNNSLSLKRLVFKLLFHPSSEFIAQGLQMAECCLEKTPCWENHIAVQLITGGVSFSTPT